MRSLNEALRGSETIFLKPHPGRFLKPTTRPDPAHHIRDKALFDHAA
jgi:hypothetical protein